MLPPSMTCCVVSPFFKITFCTVAWVPFACPSLTLLLQGSIRQHPLYSLSRGSMLPVPWGSLTSSSEQFSQNEQLLWKGTNVLLLFWTSTLSEKIVTVSGKDPFLAYRALHHSSNKAVLIESQSRLKYVAYLMSSGSCVPALTTRSLTFTISPIVTVPSQNLSSIQSSLSY